ncbi:unnamed protein product (macronuclear) [Paramecium tetraurelia]|uniref:Uncharacterized protein n=1 Tax=Paramecium tetraurelia TaxID=5888 RepID=A0CR26_PARTE|nr:uncharacterized protein GSPATT00009556001 [Paramecium tetraurelia]CAK73243.1 unnamed protein product [Paramecium tetraurelia]|eukprot:XP_001440640.1 hypothetical protein (macronuclear) [Paramecium tetraurelia strain d4-2]
MQLLTQKEVRRKRRRRRILLNPKRRSTDTEKSNQLHSSYIPLTIKVLFKDLTNNAHNVHKVYIWLSILIDTIVAHAIKHLEWTRQPSKLTQKLSKNNKQLKQQLLLPQHQQEELQLEVPLVVRKERRSDHQYNNIKYNIEQSLFSTYFICVARIQYQSKTIYNILFQAEIQDTKKFG